MGQKITRILLVFFFFLSLVKFAEASEAKKSIYFFWSRTCPHCAREKEFLQGLEQQYSRLEIKAYEISTSQANRELFQKVGQKFGSQGYIPFTVVGEFHFVGFLDQETTGKQIEEAVQCYLADGCQDVVAPLVDADEISEATPKATIPQTLDLPLIGEIKTKNLSLPVLTFLIALLDGFNPCAMWTLLFLISLLLGIKEIKRRWALGTAFIITSGLIYFLFLTAWLNLFLFLGLVLSVRIIIGLFALGAGGYSLRYYWRHQKGGCETMDDEKRQKIFQKIRDAVQRKNFGMALVGIIILAVAVNLVELACSAGLPAVYTQILALTSLSKTQYYLYLFFYILIFMLDDLIVFGVAMITLRAVGIESKYARFSRLIGGLLMLLMGGLLLFKPEWLTFS